MAEARWTTMETVRIFVGALLVVVSCFPSPTRGENERPSSLDPDKAIHQYVHDVWQAEDGLPNYAINDILRTRDGYLWMATYGGAVRFDGVTFKVFNRENTPELESNLVSALVEGRGGELWFGGASGLLRYEHGRFTRLAAEHGLSNEAVSALVMDLSSGGLWIGTSKGVSYFDGSVLTHHGTEDGLPPSPIRSLAPARGGGVWAGTFEGHVIRFTGSEWVAVEVTHPPQEVVEILEDRTGRLWLHLSVGPIRRFDGKRWVEYAGLYGTRTIYEDRSGTVWAGSKQGLIRFEAETFSAFTPEDGLTDLRIYAMHEDRESNLWIGTYGGGLNRLKNGSVTTYSRRDGMIGNSVNSIFEDAGGSLWMGTNNGLMRFDKGRWSTYTTRDGLEDGRVLAICEDRDRVLWVGTHERGLHRFDGKRFTSVDTLPSTRVAVLTLDRTGTLRIGSNQGLFSYENGVFTKAPWGDGVLRSQVTVIHQDRAGRLWVGTRHGLGYLNAEGFTVIESLHGIWIRAFHEDDEATLWIGTVGDGLYRLRSGELTRYTTVDGLPDDYVWDILEDDHDTLWMISDQGIFSVSKQTLDGHSLGRIERLSSQRYDTTDGMKTTEGVGYVHPGAIRTRDGALWFPTTQGAVRIEPDRLVRNSLPPPVVIEYLVIDDQVEMPASSSLVLSSDQRDLEIHYTGLALRNPEEVRFKYRLEGYSDEWTDAEARRVAYYTNLPPGSFVFQVIAANEDGVWNEQGASLAFTRQPAFIERRWFYALCFLVAGVVGTALYKARTRSIRRRNQALNALNKELEARNAEMERFVYTVSHDLRSPLVSIQGFLGLLEQDARKGDEEAVAHDAEVIRGAAQQMNHLLSDLLEYSRVGRVANTAAAISLDDLAREAAELVTGQLEARGVTLSIETGMPDVWGDALRLREVFQNLIENATKFFGEEPEPRLEIGVAGHDDAFVTCFVRDNGVGIEEPYQEQVFELFERLDPSIEGTGVGLALVKRIVELHGGRIRIESEGKGKGTTMLFTLPLPPGGSTLGVVGSKS